MARQERGLDLPAGREDAERDRQVEATGVLGQVGRRQVDDRALCSIGSASTVDVSLGHGAQSLLCSRRVEMGQIHIVRRVYGGVSAYKRVLDFDELQLANGGWVRQAIELYADRSNLTPVAMAEASHLVLGLFSARSNWTWVQIAAC